MIPDELDAARKKIADVRGFSLWRIYTEREAAKFIGWHAVTLQRKRLKGEVVYLSTEYTVRDVGYMIADIILSGVGRPQNALKTSETT